MRTEWLLVGTLALAACDGDNAFGGIVDVGDSTDRSDFSAVVTGDIAGTLGGEATFAVTQQGNGDETVFLLLEDDDAGTIRLFRGQGGRPAPGTVPVFDHRLGTTPAGSEISAHWITADGGTFVSLGGTVTIQSSTLNRLVGSMNFTARRIFQSGATIDTLQINVSGSFDAVEQDPGGGSEL